MIIRIKNKSKINIAGIRKSLGVQKRGMLMEMAAVAQTKFQQAFVRKKFYEYGETRWEKRKLSKEKHPLMVKSGKLVGSIRITSVTSRRAVLKASANYASYHNRGTGRLPQRQFMGDSKKLRKEYDKIVRRRLKRIFR